MTDVPKFECFTLSDRQILPTNDDVDEMAFPSIIRVIIATFFSSSMLKGKQTCFQSIMVNLNQSNHPEESSDYKDNATPFGGILRGELPALILGETASVLAFEDKNPRAALHALVIPKRHIKSVLELTEKDVDLMKDIHEMATKLIMSRFPLAYKKGDFILCFHIPPFTSVDHLHLHVLAPASEMPWVYRFGKYLEGTFWCASEAKILQGLNGKT